MKLSKLVNEATLQKVTSIADLARKAQSDPRYKQLAFDAAANLGQPSKTLTQAIQWLYTNADETDEEGVVDEINFVLDLSKGKMAKEVVKEYTKDDIDAGIKAHMPTIDRNKYPQTPNRKQDLWSFISRVETMARNEKDPARKALFNKWASDADSKLKMLEDDPDHYI